jgi:hypothetical protein
MIQAIDEVNAEAQTKPLQAVPHAPAPSSDRVVLSEAVRATLLSQEGLTVPEIADELGITTNVVMNELGITDIAA